MRVEFAPLLHFFSIKTITPMDKTAEKPRNLPPKSIKELIDMYYPEIKEKLSHGKRDGK